MKYNNNGFGYQPKNGSKTPPEPPTTGSTIIKDNKTTNDVRPNIHAHWVKDKNFDGFKIWKCSNCSCRFGDYISTEWGINPAEYAYGKYCGYCGAIMDERENISNEQ